MSRFIIVLIVLLLAFCSITFGQGYRVEIIMLEFRCSQTDISKFDGRIDFNDKFSLFSSPGLIFNYSFPNKPNGLVNIHIDTYSGNCGETYQTSIPVSLAGSKSCSDQILITPGGYTINILFKWSPIIFEFIASETAPEGCYTTEETIELSVSQGYSDYLWEYAVEGNGYKAFSSNPGSSNAISFTWNDVFGANNIPLGATVLFRARMGDCNSADVPGNYQIGLPPASINLPPELNGKACYGKNNGKLLVQLSRTLLPSEYAQIVMYSEPLVSPIKEVNREEINNSGRAYFKDISPGTYYLLFVSDQSCGSPQFTTGVTIVKWDPITFSPSTPTELLCNGSKAEIELRDVLGGSGSGYLYSKDGGLSFQNTPVFSSLNSTQEYSFVIKDDQNCFSNSDAVVIPQSPDPLDAITNVVNVSCTNLEDGEVEIIASGGIPPYQFSKLMAGPFQSSNTLKQLGAGMHTVFIKDSNNCLFETDNFNIDSPEEIIISADIIEPDCSSGLGQLIVLVNGGTGAISYSLDNQNFQSFPEFLVYAGSYTVYVKDANACIEISDEILMTSPPSITADVVAQDISCIGETDGAIKVDNIKNGVPPYEYSIDGGSQYEIPNLWQNLATGSYFLVVRDSYGCTFRQTIDINSPSQVDASIVATSISCFGSDDGVLSAVPFGGNPGSYQYSWSNGATGSTISDLSQGVYELAVTDVMGCKSDPIPYELSNPDSISIKLLPSMVNDNYNISCSDANDGSIQANVSGGSGFYSFDWSNNQTTQDISNLSAGSYTLLVTDSEGCASKASYEMMAPQKLSLAIAKKDIQCFGLAEGEVTINAFGGVEPYQYSKDNGANWQNSSFFDALEGGNFQFLVMDNLACISEMTEIVLANPQELVLSINSSVPSQCSNSDGRIIAEAEGGTPPLTYSWLNDSDQWVGDQLILDNQPSGVYTLWVEDFYGCSSSLKAAILNTDGPKITVINTTPASCSYNEDGGAEISVTGGTSPYLIEWSNGETGLSINSLKPGDNEVEVRDAQGCFTQNILTILSPDSIYIAEKIISQPSCSGETNGSIKIFASGGSGDLNYSWLNGVNGNEINELSAGFYEIQISDANNCSLIETIEILEPEPLRFETINITQPSCIGLADGSLDFDVKGGTSPYTVQIFDESINVITDQDNFHSGNYLINVEDANGCVLSEEIVIEEPEPIEMDLGEFAICEGQQILINPGIDAMGYAWYSEAGLIGTESTIKLEEPGNYKLEFITNNNCHGLAFLSVLVSDDVLTADFLLASEVFTGDTLYVIDISWPLPDSVFWDIPAEAIIVESNKDLAAMVFQQTGVFEIAMEVRLASCSAYYSSVVEVKEAEIDINGRLQSSKVELIKEVSVYPNPNEGHFNVDIELSRESSIEVLLVNLSANKVEYKNTLESSLIHQISFEQLMLSPGLYGLIVTAENQSKVVRISVM